MWSAILDRVLRRPLVSAVARGGRAARARRTGAADAHARARHRDAPAEPLRGQDLQQAAEGVPRRAESGEVLVKASTTDARGAARRSPTSSGRRSQPGSFHQPDQRRREQGADDRPIDLPIDGKARTRSRTPPLETLRDDVIPATVGTLDGADVGVTGTTANPKDSNSPMKHAAPFVFAFVLAFAFLLMLVTFRSVVIAVKAVVLNLLSVAAAYGVLVLVFQHGWGKGLLGFDYTGGGSSLPADLPVRDPVRALDGLPRVHPQPHPRGVSTGA